MSVMIIEGPNGSGKSTFAIRVAKLCGNYTVTSMSGLMEQFGLSIFCEATETIIIEGVNLSNPNHTEVIRILSISEKLKVDRIYKEVVEVNVPNLIFVTEKLVPTKGRKISNPARWIGLNHEQHD